MRTSTYIRAATAASECSTVLFDEAQLEEGEEKSLGILHRAVRKRDQSTKFSDKAIELADKLETELNDAKALAADYGERMGELCDYAWGAVYPGKTDWEYPAQAIRHLVTYIAELKTKIKTQEGSNG